MTINERISESDTTIYKSAVKKIVVDADSEITFQLKEMEPNVVQSNQDENHIENRDSFETEEQIDTSDELIEDNIINNEEMQNCFIAECQEEARRKSKSPQRSILPQPIEMSRGENMVCKAEASRACILGTKGNDSSKLENNLFNQLVIKDSYLTIADENYMVVGAHLDQTLHSRIVNHEYVDFAKLLPRGKVTKEEDHRMELVSKGGATYFVPVSDCENTGISNFSKWQQAFRVFSNIYMRIFPERAAELVQYNHIIHTAATTYSWENVYAYNKEFHMHLADFPQRSWAIILQQAWAMCLKDRIQPRNFGDNRFGYGGKQQPTGKKEICRRFNVGKYHKGFSCKYEHKCDIPECGKLGHGGHICRKRNQGNSSEALSTSQAGAHANAQSK